MKVFCQFDLDDRARERAPRVQDNDSSSALLQLCGSSQREGVRGAGGGRADEKERAVLQLRRMPIPLETKSAERTASSLYERPQWMAVGPNRDGGKERRVEKENQLKIK